MIFELRLPAWLVRASKRVQPLTHDYTRRAWGHDYYITKVIDRGARLKMSGWGSGIRSGDYLILPNGKSTSRYQVESINYRADPPDMWFAEAVFAPRMTP